MTFAIIVSDVLHNTWLMSRSPSPVWLNLMYVAQILFLAFVISTIRSAWRGLSARERIGTPLGAT